MAHQQERGIALILTLLVLSILIVVIAQMSITSSHNKMIAQHYIEDLQNSYAARAGYQHARIYLLDDASKDPNVDSLDEPWAQPLQLQIGNSTATVIIEDNNRKINLVQFSSKNTNAIDAVQRQLNRLVSNLQFDVKYALMIGDYISFDQQGAYAPDAKNGPLLNLDEILLIKNMKPEVLYGGALDGVQHKGIVDFVTSVSLYTNTTQGQPQNFTWHININTAPMEVLMALSDNMTQEIAGNIVAYRAQKNDAGKFLRFSKVDELRNVSGMTEPLLKEIQPFLGVRSSFFTIKSVGRIGTLEKGFAYTVYRDARAKTLTLLSSRKLEEFLRVQKPTEDKNHPQ